VSVYKYFVKILQKNSGKLDYNSARTCVFKETEYNSLTQNESSSFYQTQA